jgi:alkylation response protein AidB-like acyl-CoA dehydrogenase
MFLGLTPREEEIRARAREFAEKEVLPGAAARDESGEFPRDLVRRMGELGFYGLTYPAAYGGSDDGTVAYCLVAEEVARCDASLGLTMAVNATIGTLAVFLFGTEEQKRRWVPGVLRGELISAFGLTEAEAGSDAGNVRTTAVQDGDGWVLNGEKIFITNGSVADFVVVTAVTDPELGTRGISCFIVPSGTPGFSIPDKFRKMGMRSSDTARLVFSNCRVPAGNVLGRRGEGLKMFLTVLDTGRVGVSALSVGVARAALEDSLSYAGGRVQFGRPIGQNQAIAFRLADVATEIEAARLLTLSAARSRDRGGRFSTEAAMAKLFASETAVRAALAALHVHGGHGYCMEHRAERLFRDAKLMEVGEGTSEVQRMVISRGLGV